MVLTNKNKHWAWEWGLGYNRKWLLPTEGYKGQSFQYVVLDTYSKVSIIRTGRSRLLEFEKSCFSKSQTRIFNRDSKQVHEKILEDFSNFRVSLRIYELQQETILKLDFCYFLLLHNGENDSQKRQSQL